MLQKVSIQNFKSLKDVTLELQKVNLLIGPNNSGKSNFLKALERYSILFKDIGGAGQLLKLDDYFAKLPFQEISFSFSIYDYKLLPIHHIAQFQYSDNRSQLLKRDFYIANEQNDLSDDEGEKDKIVREINKKSTLCYSNFFHNLTIYKPDPNSFQKPYPILPNQLLINYNASNLVAFFDALRDEYPENYKAIENDLHKCIPELSGLRFENVEINKHDNLFKIYGDKTFKRLGLYDKNNKLTYWADELSEGTLYFLALLCIVHQPNPPKLLLLEEPEKGIHPRRIHEVMKFIFQLAEDKDIQVIMTSHNEHVLSEFAIIPEAVFIFDKDEEGATQVKNLKRDIIEPDTKKAEEFGIEPIDFTDNIGENWFMGLMGGVPA